MLVMMGSALLATAAVAQDAPAQPQPAANPEPAAKTTEVKKADMKQERVEWEKKIKTELNLTAEQSAKFDALNKEYNDKIDAVLADASLAALGTIPPNTGVLVIQDGSVRNEIRFAGDLQKSSAVVLKRRRN